MPSRREMTEADAECIKAMRGANYSYDAIAEFLGSSRNWVKERCTDLGCALSIRPCADEREAGVSALRSLGHSAASIAAATGIERHAVLAIITDLDLRGEDALPAMHPTTWGAIALPCHAAA